MFGKSFASVVGSLALLGATMVSAQQSIRLPSGWPQEVVIGLADDGHNQESLNLPREQGINKYYHYTYINTNYEPLETRLADIKKFIQAGQAKGISNSFILEFFAHEKDLNVLLEKMNSPERMREYFLAIKKLGEALWEVNALNTVFIVEPEVWGTLLHGRFHFETRKHAKTGKSYADILTFPAAVRNSDLKLGPEFDYLDMFNNNVADMARAIMVSIRRFVPSPVIGLHANTWSVYAKGCMGGASVQDINEKLFAGQFDVKGKGNLVNWTQSDIKLSAMANIRFFREIFGWDYAQGMPRYASSYWPDILAVDKYPVDAGYVKSGYVGNKNGAKLPGSGSDVFFWNQDQLDQWLDWSERLSQGLKLPLLALRIPVGNGSLPNKKYQYQDTFADWLFNSKNWGRKYTWSKGNWQRFKNAGFIGLWIGRDGWPAYGTHYGKMDFDVFAKEKVQSEGDGGYFIKTFASQDRTQGNLRVIFDEAELGRYTGFCQFEDEVEAF